MPADTSAARNVSQHLIDEAVRHLDISLNNPEWLASHRKISSDKSFVYWVIPGMCILTKREMAAVGAAFEGKGWHAVMVVPGPDTDRSNWEAEFQADL